MHCHPNLPSTLEQSTPVTAQVEGPQTSYGKPVFRTAPQSSSSLSADRSSTGPLSIVSRRPHSAMLDESMFEDIHEIAENSAYLKAVEEKDVSLEMLEQLPPYSECAELERRLAADGLPVVRVHLPLAPPATTMFSCFLIADYAVDKAIFLKDVEAYRHMRFESARQKIAQLLYQPLRQPRRGGGGRTGQSGGGDGRERTARVPVRVVPSRLRRGCRPPLPRVKAAPPWPALRPCPSSRG